MGGAGSEGIRSWQGPHTERQTLAGTQTHTCRQFNAADSLPTLDVLGPREQDAGQPGEKTCTEQSAAHLRVCVEDLDPLGGDEQIHLGEGLSFSVGTLLQDRSTRRTRCRSLCNQTSRLKVSVVV